MTSKTSKTWIPDRVAASYTDDEIMETPIFHDIGVISPGVSEEAKIELSRQCITAKYEASRIRQNDLAEIFEMLGRQGISGDKILLNRETMTAKVVKDRTTRWGPKHYVQLIGQTFTRTLLTSYHKDRNGIYNLYIEGPWLGHSVPFRARIVDPNGFETRFPPYDLNEGPQETDAYREVRCMTDLTRKSAANQPQSPAVFFNLVRPEIPKIEVEKAPSAKQKECRDCQNSVDKRSTRCKACNAKHKASSFKSTKVLWPDGDALIKLIAETSQASVARSLGVSRERVRQRKLKVENWEEKLAAAKEETAQRRPRAIETSPSPKMPKKVRRGRRVRGRRQR
jgi:hypothetical protein